MILKDALGVPYVIADGEIIAINDQSGPELVAAALDNDALLDGLMSVIKDSIVSIAGIEPDLEDTEWMGEFNRALLINEFTTPLRVIMKARREVQMIQTEEWANGEG